SIGHGRFGEPPLPIFQNWPAAFLSSLRTLFVVAGSPRQAAFPLVLLLQICRRLALCESDLSGKVLSRRSSPDRRNRLPRFLSSGLQGARATATLFPAVPSPVRRPISSLFILLLLL